MAGNGDILFLNGRFVDPGEGVEPLGEALLARDGRIAFVGSEACARARAAPNTPALDLGGRTALPGFVDAHVHLDSLGASLGQCDLSQARSRREAIDRLADYAADHADRPWILARGFNLNAWADADYPTARGLDEAVSDRPCAARSFDGHGLWVNSAAMAAAGIDRSTGDPQGGAIVRDASGRATGYLLEAAIELVHKAMPPDDEAALDERLGLAIEEMSRRGHTGVHAPMGRGAGATLERIRRLYPAGSCPLRVRCFAAFEVLDEVAAARQAARGEGERAQLTGVKCFLDGSLGSRSAWLFEPFDDGSASCGLRVLEPAELRRRIARANDASVPLICHAIGDRACAEALGAFADAGDAAAGNRIEHAQMLRPRDVGLFAAAGVAASVQPGHICTDWRPCERFLGPQRARWSYPFRSLLNGGAVLAMGSDAPVVPPDLAGSLRAAVTRTDAAGRPAGGWHAEECITPRQWAVAATRDAWRSIGEPASLGGLQAGMLCDLSVLSRDILAPGFNGWGDWTVEATIVAGRIAFCTWTNESGTRNADRQTPTAGS